MAGSYWDKLASTRVSRRRALKAAGVTGAAGGALWLVGCGGGDSTKSTPTAPSDPVPTKEADFGTHSSGAKAGGTYNVASNLDFATFDPHLSVGSSQAFFPRLYNAIINRSPRTNDFQFNDLAESLEQPDDVTYVFKIRPGVKVAPNDLGVPERDLDANDVKATFDRITTLPASTAYGFVGQWIDSTTASPDGKTVTIKTKKPYGYFFVRIGSIVNLIVPQELTTRADDMKSASAGAGPYVLKKNSYLEGQGATLVRNTNYYRKDENNNNAQLPYVDKIEAKIITDPAALRSAFQSGQTDEYTAASAAEAQTLQSGNSYSAVRDSTNTFISLVMNPTQDPWKDDRIRRAAMYAIDRKAYIDRIYRGEAKPDGLVHWPLGDYAIPEDELATVQPYDPAQARQLIKAATGNDTINVKVTWPADTTVNEHSQHLPIWLEQMKAAGFEVSSDPQPLGTWLDNYTKLNYAASLSINLVYEWAEVNMDFQHSEGPARNNIFTIGVGKLYPEIDAAIDAVKGITDPVEQAKKTQELQRQIYEKGPTNLPFVTPYAYTLYQPRVKNVSRGPGSSGLFVNTWYLDG